MRMPNWIGIGCVKCGTSWTWRELQKHPQIFTQTKEIMYFNSADSKSSDWYMEFFAAAKPNQLIGEFTPDYFHHYEARHKIKEECPDAKFIVCFRHPVDRAFSNWKHAVQEKRFRGTFMDAFRFWRVRERGIYSQYLQLWYNLFPKEQIKIMWYEDIKTRPVEYLKEIYQFLGIDDFLSPDYKDWFKFKYHRNSKLQKAAMDPEEREFWLKFYLPHTEELEKMTGMELSHWKY